MVEAFVGTWQLTASENFDDFMKELGIDIDRRKVGNADKPTVQFHVDGEVITFKNYSTKVPGIKFKLNEEFDENTTDDREATNLFTLENNKLVQKQMWDDKSKSLTVEREIQGGKLITRCILGDVVAVRTYERI